MRKESEDRTSGDSAFFESESSGYVSTGPEVVTSRNTGSRDVCEFLKQLRTSEGWTLSGFQEQKEKDGTWRLYLIMPTETFRLKYGLTPSTPPSPSQEAPGKFESLISRHLAERKSIRLAKEQPVIEAEKAFRDYAAALTLQDFDVGLEGDKTRFMTERNGDDWKILVLSRDTVRKGNFREAANIVRTGLLEANLRSPLRYINYENDSVVEDRGSQAIAMVHLQKIHQEKLNELYRNASTLRRDFQFRNPRTPLPPEAR